MPLTLLRPLAALPRPLPIALAHSMAATPFGNTKRMTILNRLYSGLSPADQLSCKAELSECKRAKRGEYFAEVR